MARGSLIFARAKFTFSFFFFLGDNGRDIFLAGMVFRCDNLAGYPANAGGFPSLLFGSKIFIKGAVYHEFFQATSLGTFDAITCLILF